MGNCAILQIVFRGADRIRLHEGTIERWRQSYRFFLLFAEQLQKLDNSGRTMRHVPIVNCGRRERHTRSIGFLALGEAFEELIGRRVLGAI
ncbi:hypothetical protein A8990_10742 [Paenibacillus taihuensis]|uniref:Uncharacterized protein n=1 Tax=Paenibacillus taihuensis TaxID=1156355 RepID=A0A3D9S702_9BACL|nr:hypothetical protein A8990_10742 [Paenibacillus taihuensis]